MDVDIPLDSDNSTLNEIVARELRIDEVKLGGEGDDYVRRYVGQLRAEDSAAAYERLDAALAPLGLMPLFRMHEQAHAVLIVKRPPAPKPSDPRVNVVLFLATVASVFYISVPPTFLATLQGTFAQRAGAILLYGGSFTLAIMAILAAHEFGHYFMARRHKVKTSLPYFIPMPLPITPFGTLGAVINMKEQPKNKRQLLDIGLAGPLAGLAVTLVVLVLGLALSPVEPLPSAPAVQDPLAFLQGNPLIYLLVDPFVPGQAELQPGDGTAGMVLEGNSLLYLGVKYLVHGRLLPAPPDTAGLNPALYWLRYFFTGQPLPYGGQDVSLHPLAWAGWFGLLITGLNLLPAGQLDGGHAIFVLVGRERARKISRLLVGLTFLLGILSISWWLWSALLYFLGRIHAEPRDEITPLDPRRKALAVFAVVLFLLVFTPVPLTGF